MSSPEGCCAVSVHSLVGAQGSTPTAAWGGGSRRHHPLRHFWELQQGASSQWGRGLCAGGRWCLSATCPPHRALPGVQPGPCAGSGGPFPAALHPCLRPAEKGPPPPTPPWHSRLRAGRTVPYATGSPGQDGLCFLLGGNTFRESSCLQCLIHCRRFSWLGRKLAFCRLHNQPPSRSPPAEAQWPKPRKSFLGRHVFPGPGRARRSSPSSCL